MKYGIYLGVGQLREDWEADYYKVQIAENLAKKWEVCIFSRVLLPKEKMPEGARYVQLDEQPFLKEYSKNEIEELEKWLGYPLMFIASHNKILHHMPRGQVEREYLDVICAHVALWRKILEENKVEVFSSSLESGLHEVVSLLVARRLGLKIINFGRGRLDYKTFAFFDGDFDLLLWKNADSAKMREAYEKEAERFNAREGAIGKEIGAAVRKKRELGIGKISAYLKGAVSYFSLSRADKTRIHSPLGKIKRFSGIAINGFVNSFLFDQIAPGKKFVLFPVHYQEEAILYFKEPFANQFEIIENISKVLPHGAFIYVKMHPHFRGGDVDFRKILKLRRLGNVKIVSYRENTLKLLRECRALATINSTTGYEALFLGKPILAFGHGLYCRDGLSTPVYDNGQLPGIVAAMMENPSSFVDEGARRDFIAANSINSFPLSTEVKTILELSEGDAKKIADELALVTTIGNRKKSEPSTD